MVVLEIVVVVRGRCCGRIPGQNVAWVSWIVGGCLVVGDRWFVVVVVGGRWFVVVVGHRCFVIVRCYESHVSNAPMSWNRWKWTMHQKSMSCCRPALLMLLLLVLMLAC